VTKQLENEKSMQTCYIVVTLLAALANLYAATNDFLHVEWVLENMDRLGISRIWVSPLGFLKAAGGLGLLAGIWWPQIGAAAAAGLILFFIGAMASAIRVRWYSHLPFPAAWLALSIGALWTLLVTTSV
jgi:hypothetical protein